jgi:hypothetical protein
VPLRRARVRELKRALVHNTFSCHKTTGAERGKLTTSNTSHCAGALILLEKLGRPSQMMRIGYRLGIYDPTKLNMKAPVFPSFRAMEAAQPE